MEPSIDPPKSSEEARPGAPRSPRRRAPFRTLGVFALALGIGLAVSFTLDRRKAEGHVLRGVHLRDEAHGNIALTGLTEAELLRTLDSRGASLLERSLAFSLNGQRFESSVGELGVRVDAQAVARAALAQGRTGSLPKQLLWWLGRLVTPATLDVEVQIDPERLREVVAKWQLQALPAPPPPPGVYYDGELRVRYPSQRAEADVATVERALPELLRTKALEPHVIPVLHQPPPISRAEVDARLRQARELLAAPVVLKAEGAPYRVQLTPALLGPALRTELKSEPEPALVLTLSVDKLSPAFDVVRPQVERKATSARIDIDAQHRITITPSEAGVRIDRETSISEILAAATRPNRSGQLVLTEERPELTTEEAEALKLRGLVSEFTTYHACCEPRVKNIHFAASQVDSILLKPGEQFSLNGLLGPRTNETGFLDAPTIVRGKMEQSPGGGISQFATTLFNAVLDGGYEIIQRQPHSYYFHRYPEGHEATVSYPLPDLVFRNDTSAGLLIKTKYGPTFIRVMLYGDNEGRRVERRISKRFDLVDPPHELEPDPGLAPDQKKLKAQGHYGWAVIATRILHYPDGRSVEQSRRVTYGPRPHVYEVHPCNVPKGKKGYTGEPCPEIEATPEGAQPPPAELAAQVSTPAPQTPAQVPAPRETAAQAEN